MAGDCKLGKELKIRDDDFARQIRESTSHLNERMQRIALKRFQKFRRRRLPSDLRSLLEYWAKKRILARSWRVGPCTRCHQSEFVSRPSSRRSIACSNCGQRLPYPDKVEIGYTLERPVRHALAEGLAPVLLTGRFLRNLTSRGFFWLPGVKFDSKDGPGDLDIVACCDGHLVFCECKRRSNHAKETTAHWGQIVDQFLRTADVARSCQADLVVLASMASAYPADFEERIRSELTGKIPWLLLAKQDLELGHRRIGDADASRRCSLDDLLPDPFPEIPRSPSSVRPRVELGWATWTTE